MRRVENRSENAFPQVVLEPAFSTVRGPSTQGRLPRAWETPEPLLRVCQLCGSAAHVLVSVEQHSACAGLVPTLEPLALVVLGQMVSLGSKNHLDGIVASDVHHSVAAI